MSEFFLELFSEEIPASLQSLARESLKKEFTKLFEEKNINLSGELKTFSTPNRLVLLANNISKDVKQAAEEIRGPSTKAPEIAIKGFIKSNKISNEDIYKKIIDKGEFYFFKKSANKIQTSKILEDHIPKIL